MNVTIHYEEMAEAYMCNHKYNHSIYSRYIQYRVLHHRIFTRDKLLKMKIIDNDSCLKCQLPDSIEHLFINCQYSTTLWTEVEEWINSIGFFLVTGKRSTFIINLILSSTKQCLYVSRESETGTVILHVKRILKKYMVTDKYWAQIKWRD